MQEILLLAWPLATEPYSRSPANLSPGNTRAEMAAKVRDFLAAGAKAVWVVDPPRQEVTVHRPGRPPETLPRYETLLGDPAVPGFRLPVREIFEG